MVWDQRPSVTLGLGFLKDHSKSFQKGGAIFIVPKDFPAFNSPGHYVLKDTGSIKSWLAWHKVIYQKRLLNGGRCHYPTILDKSHI